MSSADAADYGFKRFRVARACVVCRLRKTKCNGEQPCDRCKAHSAECKYDTIETVPRRASRAASTSSAGPSVTPKKNTENGATDQDGSPDASDRPSKKQKRAMIDQIAERRWGDKTYSRSSSNMRKSGYVIHHLELYSSIDQDEPPEEDPELHTEDGIRAHDQATGNMQFYGFTSNFNFQHRLAQTIEALRLREQLQPTTSNPSIGRGRNLHLPESMKTWGHHNIIFRHNLSESSFPTLDASKDAVGDSTFLPPSIVDRFVENYMTLIQPQLAAVPKRQILKWVKDAKAMGYLSRGFSGAPWTAASGPGNSKQNNGATPATMRTNELAALYVVLALGAMMDEGDWEDVYAPVPMTREGALACATTLFLLAKKRLEEIVENSSLQSARCLVLMSFFSLQWSSPNVAYLYIGHAIRISTSIGLHRETSYASSNPRSSEYRQLWWTCYSIERMISTWFGQASAIRDDDVSTRMPQAENSYDAYLLVNAQIAKLCSDVAKLSANPPTNAQDVLLAAERMDAEMIRIRQQAPKELSVGLQDKFGNDADDDSDSSDLVVRRYTITTFWWYLRLLIHSFGMIFALYCRSVGTNIPRNVLEKANISARAGQQIIDAICNARSDMPRPGLDNMRFGSFYLDSACTIVLSAILCDPSNQELAFGYLASIDRAIKYLEKKDKIYGDHGTRASLHKARDLVVLARQVVRAAASQSASGRVQNGARKATASAAAADGTAQIANAGLERRSKARSNGPTSTFSTSSERGTAGEDMEDENDDEQEPTRAGTDHARQAESRTDSPQRLRDRSMDLNVASLLSPPNSGARTQPPGPAIGHEGMPPPASTTDQRSSYATERDDWMQYFLSNFDWLGPMSQPGSSGTPQSVGLSSPFFVGASAGGPSPNAMLSNHHAMQAGQGNGLAHDHPLSSPRGVSHATQSVVGGVGSATSPGLSSPGSAAGPASLSELDMGWIMGGVSVMESDQQ